MLIVFTYRLLDPLLFVATFCFLHSKTPIRYWDKITDSCKSFGAAALRTDNQNVQMSDVIGHLLTMSCCSLQSMPFVLPLDPAPFNRARSRGKSI
ncbi:hypothetical protein C0081_07670 [Cohaesibacter celericrescens]|uniref:Uncharacterized protein n=1 Tax=Cohaesibacter celericrescens TaxID=2067669 RepID=A0A2N5XTH8_9HYPH|nr:hypothetical protein C0081_07670 [Cohaesibacter celericrescens]